MVKSIFLQDGEEIFVDDEDYGEISQYTWTKSYGSGKSKNSRRIYALVNTKKILLNTFILKGSHQKVKNNDFTKSNLTTKGNARHWVKATEKGKSKYKGVTWHKASKKWVASIRLKGRNKYLGIYHNEDDAAKAYNNAVNNYWGGNGYLNIIGEDNRTPNAEYRTDKNRNKRILGSSGYKNISKTNSGFYARIRHKNKSTYIQSLPSIHQAALSYNKCVIYLFGDNAIINDVPLTDELKEFIDNWEIPDKIKALKEGSENE
ncbi:AP2 domain-containing protein [Staphylococcus warneri]|uniref:AP2 domain-containing protein n=1 Tax=Staphylococcus warneri TaxID=1292 RepID=UPI0019CFCE1C|nr:AP2 domain-containing protein [Staphylococcus warneri]MBN6852270.1 AP2 domain-containing protein [Staphylococcus warneri]